MLDLNQIKLESVPLKDTDRAEIQTFSSKLIESGKVDPAKVGKVQTIAENMYKYTSLLQEAGIVSADITPFRDIAIISATRLFTSSVIDKIASIQPLQNPYDNIFYIDYQYGDTAGGVTAGDSLAGNRTTAYATHTEGGQVNRLKLQVTSDTITAGVRPLEIQYTFESFLALSSLKGSEYANNLINNRLTNIASRKLRDEIELSLINSLASVVPAGNVVQYTCDTTSTCTEDKCKAALLYKAIQEASDIIYEKYGVFANKVIVGKKAKQILNKLEDVQFKYADGQPIGLVRQYQGTIDQAFEVIYDPSVTDVYVLYKDNDDEYGATIVYAPYIPLAMTDSFTDPNTLTSQRTLFSVDAVKVVKPEFIAKVELVNC